jgi:hydroxymethylpyrimidine pyrophosphatase-like HAD family hydrolase
MHKKGTQKTEMEHRVLAIDLDGTLLSKFKRISKTDLIAIKAYVQAGGLPIITTGRSIVSAKEYTNIIDNFTGSKSNFIVAFNGSYIYNVETQQTISYKVPNDLCHTLYDYCKAHKISL